MKRANLLAQFKNQPYITVENLKLSAESFSIEPRTLESHIHKSIQNRDIIPLKRGLYTSRDFLEAHKTDESYYFFLANLLLSPSYISLDTALQYYGLIPEAINYGYTSVTSQLPRTFNNKLGNFSYRKMKPGLFNDFILVEAPFPFAIASPSKAIFDYLYYYTHQFSQNLHEDILEDLRINTDELSSKEKKKLQTLLQKYCPLTIHI